MLRWAKKQYPACIKVTCNEKGHQECAFDVDMGEEFPIYNKISSKRMIVVDTRGHPGYLATLALQGQDEMVSNDPI